MNLSTNNSVQTSKKLCSDPQHPLVEFCNDPQHPLVEFCSDSQHSLVEFCSDPQHPLGGGCFGLGFRVAWVLFTIGEHNPSQQREDVAGAWGS